jgi:hypothetical protein
MAARWRGERSRFHMKISIALCGAILALVVVPAPRALGQSGTLPRDITQPSAPLTEGQRSQVAQFVEQWIGRLETPIDNPAARQSIDQARRALAGPQTLTAPGGLSPHFRSVYSELLIPHLQRILGGDDDRAAVDALHIASKLGTDAAMNLVIEQIESDNPHLRAAAAARARLGVADFQAGGTRTMVAPAVVTTLARTTAEMATVESEPFALQRQIELLNAVHSAALAREIGALANDVEAARRNLLDYRADRLANSEIDAMTVLIDTLRDHYQFTPEIQQAEGPGLAGSIHKLLASATRNWDEAQNQASVREAYERLIADCESFLGFIDKIVRRAQVPPTPNTQLPQHWEQNDRPGYEEDLQQWELLFDDEPYRSGIQSR